MCPNNNHAWIVRVGSLSSDATSGGRVGRVYDSIEAFADYCVSSVSVNMSVTSKHANFNVFDSEEGNIDVSVAL